MRGSSGSHGGWEEGCFSPTRNPRAWGPLVPHRLPFPRSPSAPVAFRSLLLLLCARRAQCSAQLHAEALFPPMNPLPASTSPWPSGRVTPRLTPWPSVTQLHRALRHWKVGEPWSGQPAPGRKERGRPRCTRGPGVLVCAHGHRSRPLAGTERGGTPGGVSAEATPASPCPACRRHACWLSGSGYRTSVTAEGRLPPFASCAGAMLTVPLGKGARAAWRVGLCTAEEPLPGLLS